MNTFSIDTYSYNYDNILIPTLMSGEVSSKNIFDLARMYFGKYAVAGSDLLFELTNEECIEEVQNAITNNALENEPLMNIAGIPVLKIIALYMLKFGYCKEN
jgi:hypothetical protein